MKYLTIQLLHELHEQTESAITTAIHDWQKLTDVQLSAKPSPDQWSAAQCLEHLNSYGRYYLPAIEKAILLAKGENAVPWFKSSLLGNYFYKLMLPDTNGQPRKKMRSPKDHSPAEDINGIEALGEFISQQETFMQLLDKARRININKARVGISIAPFIKLKLGDVFLFVAAHNQRHIMQARRALIATGSKQSGVHEAATPGPTMAI